MPRTKKPAIEVEYAEEVQAAERIKRKARSAKKNPAAQNQKAKPAPAKKKPIKRLREKRRQQSAELAAIARAEEDKRKKRKVDAGIDHPGNIIAQAEATATATDITDFYWEVEAVVGRRKYAGRIEYLIRWKGCGDEDNTWEPAANLCDTASKFELDC